MTRTPIGCIPSIGSVIATASVTGRSSACIAGVCPNRGCLVETCPKVAIATPDALQHGDAVWCRISGSDSEHSVTFELDKRQWGIDVRCDSIEQTRHQRVSIGNLTVHERVFLVRKTRGFVSRGEDVAISGVRLWMTSEPSWGRGSVGSCTRRTRI